jgi:hypothetical protein
MGLSGRVLVGMHKALSPISRWRGIKRGARERERERERERDSKNKLKLDNLQIQAFLGHQI